MMMVLALGMSMPVSMMVEQSKTLNFCVKMSRHHLFQLALAQLSVRHADAGFGQQGFQPLAHILNRIHFIVQEKYLPAAFEFAQHGFAHAAFAERFDKGFDGEVGGWGRW